MNSRRLSVLGLVVLAIACAPGCAGRAGAAAPAAGAGAQLARLGERQAAHPEQATMRAPPPPGLASLAVETDESGGQSDRRLLPLEDVIRQLAGPLPPESSEGATSPEAARMALRLYARGRERLLRSDAPGALTDLRRATELDPGAGSAWLALGDAQAATGSRAEALASIERAALLGAGGARPWEQLGRHSLTGGDHAKAAAQLSRAAAALRSGGGEADPALGILIGIELGQALEALGYFRAATDSLRGSLALLDSAQGTMRYRAELASIARRHGDLWERTGDLACRAGDYATALAAYDLAWGLPAFGSGREGLPSRRVFAALRVGNPGAAGAAIHSAIVERAGWIDDPMLGLCRYFGVHGGARAPALLERALAEAPGADAGGSLAGRLVLARAALRPGPWAERILAERVEASPRDPEAAPALLRLAGAESAERAAERGARIVGLDPGGAEGVARVLVSGHAVDELVSALDRGRTGAPGALLAARLLASVDDLAGAARRLDRVAEMRGAEPSVRLAALVAIVETASAAGRWSRAEGALRALEGPWTGVGEESLAWARAAALAGMQRYGEALAALEPAADGPEISTGSVEHLLAAAELALLVDRPADAARWLSRAGTLDERDQRVHARLIAVHAPGGALADQARLNEAIRRLRTLCPEGRLVRMLRAQELARRGSRPEAGAMLLELSREAPEDPEALGMLVEVCESLDSPAPLLNEAERFLRERAADAPDSGGFLIALARVLAAGGGHEEAERLLRERLAARPRRDLARAIEHLMRLSGRGDAADAAALARLEATGPDKSIAEVLELAELLERSGRAPEAGRVLIDGLPPGAMLNPGQGRVLLRVAEAATAARGNLPNEAGLALLDLAAERLARLPTELHERRLGMLISDPRTEPERLLEAANLGDAHAGRTDGAAVRAVLAQLIAGAEGSSGAGPARALGFARVSALERAEPLRLAMWLQAVGRFGGADELATMIDSALNAGVEGEVASLLMRSDGAPVRAAPTGAAGAAELAHLAGLIASGDGRDDAAATMYRVSLSYDPAHAWSANNLAYHLIETARSADGSVNAAALEEGERLLVGAAAALPGEGSVLDSLGWARYRLGILRDQTDETGAVRVEGAITLLARAARTPSGQSNHTILDHLGDALWRAGEEGTAAGAWSTAELVARKRLDELRSSGASDRRLSELVDLLSTVSRKLAAVRAGQEPETGWTLGGS